MLQPTTECILRDQTNSMLHYKIKLTSILFTDIKRNASWETEYGKHLLFAGVTFLKYFADCKSETLWENGVRQIRHWKRDTCKLMINKHEPIYVDFVEWTRARYYWYSFGSWFESVRRTGW
jgi:hypothetical protein